MNKIDAEYLLIIICSVVILSYFFSIISRYIRVPSVLLLLFGGVFFRRAGNRAAYASGFETGCERAAFYDSLFGVSACVCDLRRVVCAIPLWPFSASGRRR